MVQHFEVLWSELAIIDAVQIVGFVAADSPLNARKLFLRLSRKVSSLRVSPSRGWIVPELAGIGIESYREVLLGPYRVIYRVDERTVYVNCILDGRRHLHELLLERLVRPPSAENQGQ